MNLTRLLAARVAALTLDQVPEDAARHAKDCILDGLSVAVAAAEEPAAVRARAFALRHGKSDIAALWGHSGRTTAALAALVNGVAAHALDYDDIHQAVPVHATVAVLPAVAAAAEEQRADMADLLLGYCAGVETAIRVGLALGRTHSNRGFHPTGTAGTFGAAAGVGKVLDLGGEELAHAIALAGCQASGLMQVSTGTMAKSLNAGTAAMNGLLCAALARDGYTGPADVFAPERGYPEAASDGIDPAPLREDWLSDWELSRIGIKLLACGSLCHSALYAGRMLREEEGLRPEEIERIELDACPRQLDVVGKKSPADGLDGKFSLAYNVALGVSGARGLREDFTDERAGEPALLALARKVEYRVVEDMSEIASRLRAWTTSGRLIEKYHPIPRGYPGNRATGAELEEKVRSLMEPVLGRPPVEEILALVRECGAGAPAARLARALSKR